MVPTTRPDLLRGTIAQMNVRDVMAAVSLQPRPQLRVEGEVHHLALAHRQDRWYSGTGATAFSGDYFGYASRGSTLRTGLGTFVQFATIAAVKPQWTVTGRVGAIRGGDVVRRQFAGAMLWVMTLESALLLR
jgi:hypothetical protein